MIAEETYLKPISVAEAIECAKNSDDFTYIAGGTDVMVNQFQGNNDSISLIDLSGVS